MSKRTLRKSINERIKDKNEKKGHFTWVIQGRVTDEKDQGIGGCIVKAFDRDLRSEDLLGIAVTDELGRYELEYKMENLHDSAEARSCIYIKVLGKEGRALYSLKKAFRSTPCSITDNTVIRSKYELGKVVFIRFIFISL